MKAIILDRDNTINLDKGYTHKVEDLQFLPKAIEGLKIMHAAGYALIIITNQSGIARGTYSLEQYQAFKEAMHAQLLQQGIQILDEYFCPHHPQGIVPEYTKECDCRKPASGMLEQAIEQHHLDPKKSWCIGDKPADILAGLKVGARCIGILSRESKQEELEAAGAEFVCNNLEEAAHYILEKDL